MRTLMPDERSRVPPRTGHRRCRSNPVEPDRHQQFAECFERTDGAGRDLERALFHYAVAVRLYGDEAWSMMGRLFGIGLALAALVSGAAFGASSRFEILLPPAARVSLAALV